MKQPISIITLDYPLELPEGIVTELTMRRPTALDEIKYAPASRDLRQQMKEELIYFAYLCGRKPHELELMDMADYDKLQEQYLFFRNRKKDGSRNEDYDGAPESPGYDAAE